MLFATSFNEHVGWTLILTGSAIGFLWHMLKKVDTEGTVRGRAKGKLISILFKRLK